MFPLNVFNEISAILPFVYSIPLAITCSKLTIETLEQGMKYFQN